MPPARWKSASRAATLGTWPSGAGLSSGGAGGGASVTLPPSRCRTEVRHQVQFGGGGSRCSPPAEHLDADLLLGHLARVLAGDAALVEDEDPVRQRQDLVQLEGDEQDRAPAVTLLDESPVQ